MQNKNMQQDAEKKQFAAGGMKKDESASKEFQKPNQRSEDLSEEQDDDVERAPAREERDPSAKRTTEQKDKGSRV